MCPCQMLTRACAAMRTAAGGAGSSLLACGDQRPAVGFLGHRISTPGPACCACAWNESQWVDFIGRAALLEPPWRLQPGLRLVDACSGVPIRVDCHS